MLNTSSPPTRLPRRDAQRRREALIEAAADCFRAEGYGVALEVIADRAGVGRGTLYRNFKDREALALAIFSREVDRLEATFDPSAPLVGAIRSLVLEQAAASALYARIAMQMTLDSRDLAAFRALGGRLERMLEPAVSRARLDGEIRRSVTAGDVVLAVRMINGLLVNIHDRAEQEAQVDAALDLLVNGLRPGSAVASSPGRAPC